MSGWIKLHRRLLDWEWIDDHNTFRLFIFMLMLANHADKKWRGEIIKSGSFITGRESLAKKTGLSVQQVRTSISKLKSTSEITIKKSNKFSIISITNWSEYQEINQQVNQQVTNNQPASNQQVTTNKNVKKEKNVKNIFVPPTIEEVAEYCMERKNNINPKQFINHYTATGWMRGKNKIKDWKACVRTWEQNDNNNQQPINPQYMEIL